MVNDTSGIVNAALIVLHFDACPDVSVLLQDVSQGASATLQEQRRARKRLQSLSNSDLSGTSTGDDEDSEQVSSPPSEESASSPNVVERPLDPVAQTLSGDERVGLSSSVESEGTGSGDENDQPSNSGDEIVDDVEVEKGDLREKTLPLPVEEESSVVESVSVPPSSS